MPPTHPTTRPTPAAALAVAALFVLGPSSAEAWHLDEEELREEGLELEVEDLEVERDDDRVEVDYQIDSIDWQRAQRAGLSLWLGIFVERGRAGSGQWDLWYSMPLLSEDGSAHFPEHLGLERDHVVARFVAVSNGSYLSPGAGLFTDGSLYVAVRGNHEDDHSHGEAEEESIRRHVELEHRSSAVYSIDTHLSFVGSLHRYAWFQPAYGFHRFRFWLRRQHLLTQAYRRHLHHHHAHGGSGHHHHRHHHHGGAHRGGIEFQITFE